MEIIFLLIAVSLILVVTFAAVLLWAIGSGQFDDLEGQGHQILMDDDEDQCK
jgi:cbb3-type cytochrome oxidase maturation protein